jgi:hypothetical protein
MTFHRWSRCLLSFQRQLLNGDMRIVTPFSKEPAIICTFLPLIQLLGCVE